MSSETTPADPGDADNSNWEARYRGLQKVLSTRDRELATAVAERQTLAAQIEAQKADLTEYEEFRQAKAAADAEQSEREQYEALRAKFDAEEPAPSPPQRPNEMSRLGWTDRYERKPAEERTGGDGWPI